MKPFFLALLAVVFVSENLYAKSAYKPGVGAPPFAIRAEVISMSGSGCPAGTASAAVSPNGTSVSILFDQMGVELGATPQLIRGSALCMIRLGFRFSGQYRIAIVGSDVRGFVGLPAGAQGTLSVNHYSIFTMDPKVLGRMSLKKSFQGPITDNVQLSSRFPNDPLWSYCGTQQSGAGASVPLITIALQVDSENQNIEENSIALIDSLDIGSPIEYQLQWTHDKKTCPK